MAAAGALKVVLVGDSKCGKTSLLNAFVNDNYHFNQPYSPTSFGRSLRVDEQLGVTFDCWDTSGSPAYDSVRGLAFADADVFVLCYSVADPISLLNVRNKWAPLVLEHSKKSAKTTKKPTLLLLCGCQRDLRSDRRVLARLGRTGRAPISSAAAEAVAAELIGALHVDCSAAQGQVKHVFHACHQLLIDNIKANTNNNQNDNDNVSVRSNKNEHKSNNNENKGKGSSDEESKAARLRLNKANLALTKSNNNASSKNPAGFEPINSNYFTCNKVNNNLGKVSLSSRYQGLSKVTLFEKSQIGLNKRSPNNSETSLEQGIKPSLLSSCPIYDNVQRRSLDLNPQIVIENSRNGVEMNDDSFGSLMSSSKMVNRPNFRLNVSLQYSSQSQPCSPSSPLSATPFLRTFSPEPVIPEEHNDKSLFNSDNTVKYARLPRPSSLCESQVSSSSCSSTSLIARARPTSLTCPPRGSTTSTPTPNDACKTNSARFAQIRKVCTATPLLTSPVDSCYSHNDSSEDCNHPNDSPNNHIINDNDYNEFDKGDIEDVVLRTRALRQMERRSKSRRQALCLIM